jgi:hypothetical protein
MLKYNFAILCYKLGYVRWGQGEIDSQPYSFYHISKNRLKRF